MEENRQINIFISLRENWLGWLTFVFAVGLSAVGLYLFRDNFIAAALIGCGLIVVLLLLFSWHNNLRHKKELRRARKRAKQDFRAEQLAELEAREELE